MQIGILDAAGRGLTRSEMGLGFLSTRYLDSEGIQTHVFTHLEEREAAVSAVFSGERLFQLMQELRRRTRASFPVRRQGTGKELPPCSWRILQVLAQRSVAAGQH